MPFGLEVGRWGGREYSSEFCLYDGFDRAHHYLCHAPYGSTATFIDRPAERTQIFLEKIVCSLEQPVSCSDLEVRKDHDMLEASFVCAGHHSLLTLRGGFSTVSFALSALDVLCI